MRFMCRSFSLFGLSLLFAGSGLSGCGLWSRPGAAVSPEAPAHRQEKAAPLKADVTQAFFVGDVLHVSVQVFALTELDPEKLLVKLVGLKQGAVAAADAKRGSEVVQTGVEGSAGGKAPPSLDEGDSLLFRLSVPAAELSEYQLQISWGDESRKSESSRSMGKALNSTEKAPAAEASAGSAGSEEERARASLSHDSGEITGPSAPTTLGELSLSESTQAAAGSLVGSADASGAPGGGLEISGSDLDEQTISCATEPCDKRYSIRAELRNASGHEISSIKLAVGIYFSVAGQVGGQKKNFDSLGEGEEVVDLKTLRLQPGERKRLRIAVDRSVPIVPGGVFLPYVRLLSQEGA